VPHIGTDPRQCACCRALNPESVDLTKAKKGDKVRFRCGGEATIEQTDGDERLPALKFSGLGESDDAAH